MPADEAPAVSPAPAPNDSVDDPATGLLDEALARTNRSMAARRLELPSGPTSEPEQATETLSDRSVSTLAGAAALAVGGYRVLLGRSDRIKRHWMPGRFMRAARRNRAETRVDVAASDNLLLNKKNA